jgi:hypothetical protein
LKGLVGVVLVLVKGLESIVGDVARMLNEPFAQDEEKDNWKQYYAIQTYQARCSQRFIRKVRTIRDPRIYGPDQSVMTRVAHIAHPRLKDLGRVCKALDDPELRFGWASGRDRFILSGEGINNAGNYISLRA